MLWIVETEQDLTSVPSLDYPIDHVSRCECFPNQIHISSPSDRVGSHAYRKNHMVLPLRLGSYPWKLQRFADPSSSKHVIESVIGLSGEQMDQCGQNYEMLIIAKPAWEIRQLFPLRHHRA